MLTLKTSYVNISNIDNKHYVLKKKIKEELK